MENNLFLGLVYNASLLLAMVLVFDLSTGMIRRRTPILWQVLSGIFLGGVGLAVMLTNWELFPGVVFDTRSVLLSVTGLYFGWITTSVAMLVTGLFRVVQGGGGVYMGVTVILVSGLVGLIWRSLRKDYLYKLSWLEIYVFGLVVHVGMMLCTTLLPEEVREKVQTNIWLPVMTIYPVATLLLGYLMSSRLRREVIVNGLTESEEKYRTLVEQSADGILISDKEGRLLMANSKWKEIFGYIEDEIGSLNLGVTYLQEERKQLKRRMSKVLSGEALHFVRKAVTKDGRILVIEVDAKRVMGDNIQEFMRDITERVNNENALRESEEKFAKVFRNSPEIVSISTLKEGVFLEVNDAFTKELGYERSEVLGKSAFDFSFWVNTGERRTIVSELKQRRTIKNREYEFRRKNGEIITCLCSMTTMRLGQYNCLLILAVNIEDRKRAEKELKKASALILQEKQNFESVLQEMGDAIVVTDALGTVTLINKTMLGLCGACVKRLLKNNMEKTIPWVYESSGERPDDMFRSVFEKKETAQPKETVVLTNLEGKKILLDVVGTPILKNGGELLGSVWILRDITKEKELEKLRVDFISMASHQLRTPLTGIKWFVELLSGDTEKIPIEKIREYVLKIGESSNRMISLVNDLLTTSRADGGKLEKNVLSYGVKELLQQAIENQGRLFLEKRMKVVGLEKIPADLKIEVDKIQILQVLGNLLSNAVNYSFEGGEVEVGAKPRENEAEIWVTDHGVGIPESQKGKIFGKFFRADNVMKTVPGSGLGLYVAKSMVESHGGKIWFESKENEGTTFYVDLPLKQETEPKEIKK